MTTHISIDTSVAEDNNINFIPCSINYDGRARVSSYFREKPESNRVKIASFRGRPLLGSEVQLPEGYCGYVVHKTHGPKNESRVFDVQQSFKKINYWNLDRVPSKNDAIISALDWIDISNAIHAKVKPEDIKEENSLTNSSSENNDTDSKSEDTK